MRFGELLKECINKQDITIYQLAKESGIDRSFLQGILNSTRKLPPKRFSDIVNTNFFTAQQVHNLCENYFTERFGKEKLDRFDYLEKGLTGKIKEALESKYPAEIIEIKKENSFYSNKKEILNIINTILNTNEIKNFVSNFDFLNDEINRMVYTACSQKKIVNFFHFTNFDTSATKRNLSIIFNSLHYAQIGYVTYSYKKYFADSLMPFFIITDNYFLSFDENVQNAFLINTEFMTSFLNDRLKSIVKECKPIIIVNDNAMDYMNLTNTLIVGSSSKYVTGFDNNMCPTFITSEIMEAIATPVVKNIPAVFTQLAAHYDLNNSAISGKAPINSLTITYESIDDFVRNGTIKTFPRLLANPVPKEMRSHFLKALIDRKNIDKLTVTNPNIVNFSYDFDYQINNTSLIFSTSRDLTDPTDFNGSITYYSDDEIIVEDFKDYLDFISMSEKSFSLSDSKKIIETFIKSCEI